MTWWSFLFVFIVLQALAVPTADRVQVTIKPGKLSGFQTTGNRSVTNSSASNVVPLAAFLGIPYGESAAGAGRWNVPTAKLPWDGTRDAVEFGAACPGGNSVADNLNITFSEDCLVANVWTPMDAVDTASKLPVVVWIHGGGFMLGTGADAVWWGNTWAANDLVFVSFDYRIGALGFFSSDSLDAVNFGLLDQRLLLQWVQTNIHAFGGDPNQVTIYGQSAGAMSVVLHLVSPESKGLFHRGIANSPVGVHYRSYEENRPVMKGFANLLFCDQDDLACLRKRTYKEIVAAQLAGTYSSHLFQDGFVNFLPWVPTWGGGARAGALAADPSALLLDESHAVNTVPFLLGSVMNETDAWLPRFVNTTLELKLLLAAVYGENASAIETAYSGLSLSPFQTVGVASTDSLATCYVRHISRLASQRGLPVYTYQFLHAPSAAADPTNHKQAECISGEAACHASDNVFCLGSVDLVAGVVFTDEERALSNQLVHAWTSFAKGNSPPVVAWPLYGPEEATFAWRTAGPEVVHDYHSAQCDLWDTIGYQKQ